jgi:hypothetical protein
VLQSTPNSALGINANSPSPFAGLDSFYGPWTQQIDLGLTRRFNLTERQAVALQVQVFRTGQEWIPHSTPPWRLVTSRTVPPLAAMA